MGMRLNSQPGQCLSVNRRELGGSQEMGWGRWLSLGRRLLLVFARNFSGFKGAFGFFVGYRNQSEST